MLRRLLFSAAVAALAACTPDPPATSAADVEAKRFEPRPGMSAVYIVRTSDLFLLGAAARVNDQPAVMLGRKDYVRFDVQPGASRILCGEGDTPYVLNLAAGQVAYIEAAVIAGMVTGRCTLIPLDELNGRDRVLAGRRVAAR